MGEVLAERLVHLDLKGAAPTVEYMEQVFPLMSRWGATGLLIEYEDSFPYEGDLKHLAGANAYTKDEIQQILKLASQNGLTVMPLVQTFGHVEFVLKNEEFRHLRESERYPMAFCPSHPETLPLTKNMVDQVMALHPNIHHFHLGCDEVYHLGLCPACRERMMSKSIGKEQLFFTHVKSVAQSVKDAYPELTCIIWDDMFRFAEPPVILNCDLKGLVEPMVWHYLPTFMLPKDIWDNLSAVFPNVWVASAFKGATGPRASITNIQYHLDNHDSWMEVLRTIRHKFKQVCGIAITGWQRYDHFAVLCELLPHALPCLGLCLQFVKQGSICHSDTELIGKDLGFGTPIPVNPYTSSELPVCNFPGSGVYSLMIEFVHLESACNEFLASDSLAAWMNDYNVDRGFANPIHVEPMLARAVALYNGLKIVEGKVPLVFNEVYKQDSVIEEWTGSFLSCVLRKMEVFVTKARSLIASNEAKLLEKTESC